MDNEIISYVEMCRREGASLQQGMNFFPDRGHSVVLMSVQSNAPYRDRIEDGGSTLIYEGHDAPAFTGGPDPKKIDQPASTASGSLTQNGRFQQAASEFTHGTRPPRVVRVYEKLRRGIWSYNGPFELVDAWTEAVDGRTVFKFRLSATPDREPAAVVVDSDFEHRRLIPTSVKLAVWKRDGGRCIKCGAKDGLHFDHVLPYSLGGASVLADNIQLLCARHNIQKAARLE
jgi:hypothetical protein